MEARLYSRNRTVEMRSLQIWTILVGAAHRRETLTYKLLANLLNYGGAGVLDRQLGRIMHWCSDRALPPLTALVVNSDTGLPGVGLTSPTDLHSEREVVFGFEWFDVIPPTIEELEAYKGM